MPWYGWCGAASGAAAVGLWAAPQTLEPTVSGAVTHWGGWTLETTFVGVVLVAALATFRVVEVLYRAKDAPALRALPLSGVAVGLDRLRTCVAETLLGNLLVGVFVAVPALVAEAWPALAASLVLLAAATVVTPLIAFGVVVSAGVASAVPRSAAGRAVASGGPASADAAHHFAPGAAFGAVAALLLLAKLGAEDPLRVSSAVSYGFSKAAAFGLSLPVLASVALGGYALRGYGRHHDALQARFVDAEAHRVDTGYAYFTEGPLALSPLERRLGLPDALLYRKDRLQLARSKPFLRVGSYAIAALALVVGWAGSSAVSASGLGLALVVWLAVMVAPYRRLASLHGEEEYGFADMLAPADARLRSRRWAAAIETSIHAVPLALAGLALGLAGAATLAGIVVAGAAALIAAGRVSRGTWPMLAAAVGGGAAGLAGNVGALGPLAVAGLCVLIAVLALASDRRPPAPATAS